HRSKTRPSGGRPTQPFGGTLRSNALDPTFLDAVVEFIGKGPAGAPAEAADEIIWAIAQRATQLAFSGENIPRSLCLAAVEKIEGQTRPLARKRRKRAT